MKIWIGSDENCAPAGRSAVAVEQASVVAYRREEGELKACLITSLRKKKWIFPKGARRDGLSLPAAASRAAVEEAGLLGSVHPGALGTYTRLNKGGSNFLVKVFLMEVERCEEQWLESHLRQRRWVRFEEATKFVMRPELQDMLTRARRRICS